MTPEKLKQFEELLRRLLAETEALDRTSAEDRAVVELDQQSVGRLSRMDALQRQAMAQATARRRRLDGARIRAALERLGEGEFGYCQECGAEIPQRRLEIDPTAALCVDCAS